jgi:predicted transport protein
MEESLKAKTGKDLKTWIRIAKQTGFAKHGQILKFLKEEHGLTHGYANFVALKTLKSDAGSMDDRDLVNNQYKGKERLLMIYVKLLNEINSFGNDIEIAPKKSSVSLRTKKQFVLIQPSTKTRIDLGLKLKDIEPVGRLGNSGPFGTMCTHRIQLTDLLEVDKEVVDYMRLAYEQSKE